MTLAIVALTLVPSQSAYARCNISPDFKARSHSKWCGMAQYQYLYKGHSWYAGTWCYRFQGYAWMCGFSSRYELGTVSSCRKYY